jgi:pilus assembly protein CpaE
VLVFTTDSMTATAVAEALPGATLREGGLGTAIGALSQTLPPPVVVVDLTDTEDATGGIASLARICGGQCRIVALGPANDVALYHALREAGAADYLVKPVAPETLAASVARTGARHEPGAKIEKRLHRLFVCGARGGTGATTFAVNAAWHLSRREGFRVTLIDLDLAFGSVALALDIEPSHGLRDILENPDRVDGLFVASAAARMGDTLSVLAAEELLTEVGVPPSACDTALERLFETLEDSAECIVVDVPRSVAVARPGIFAHADRVILLAEMNLAAARDAARIAHLVQSVAPECPLSLVANKCGSSKGEIDKAAFVRGSRLTVDFQLPWDPKAAAAAANVGQPIAQAVKASPLARAIAASAESLVPTPDTGAGRSLWNKIVGRK